MNQNSFESITGHMADQGPIDQEDTVLVELLPEDVRRFLAGQALHLPLLGGTEQLIENLPAPNKRFRAEPVCT